MTIELGKPIPVNIEKPITAKQVVLAGGLSVIGLGVLIAMGTLNDLRDKRNREDTGHSNIRG